MRYSSSYEMPNQPRTAPRVKFSAGELLEDDFLILGVSRLMKECSESGTVLYSRRFPYDVSILLYNHSSLRGGVLFSACHSDHQPLDKVSMQGASEISHVNSTNREPSCLDPAPITRRSSLACRCSTFLCCIRRVALSFL